jgi:hypothetical protein
MIDVAHDTEMDAVAAMLSDAGLVEDFCPRMASPRSGSPE